MKWSNGVWVAEGARGIVFGSGGAHIDGARVEYVGEKGGYHWVKFANGEPFVWDIDRVDWAGDE